MSKKTTATEASNVSGSPSEESSQHIWLAGLGAMAKAQSQGTKAFEALIADGLAMQRKTQLAAQEKISEATEKLSHLAKDFGQQTTGRIDRLEHLFEDRVARALPRLGIPSMADLEALSERVAQLEAQLAKASARAPAAKTAKMASKVAAKVPKTSGQTAVMAKARPAAKKTR